MQQTPPVCGHGLLVCEPDASPDEPPNSEQQTRGVLRRLDPLTSCPAFESHSSAHLRVWVHPGMERVVLVASQGPHGHAACSSGSLTLHASPLLTRTAQSERQACMIANEGCSETPVDVEQHALAELLLMLALPSVKSHLPCLLYTSPSPRD